MELTYHMYVLCLRILVILYLYELIYDFRTSTLLGTHKNKVSRGARGAGVKAAGASKITMATMSLVALTGGVWLSL